MVEGGLGCGLESCKQKSGMDPRESGFVNQSIKVYQPAVW